MEDVGPLPNIFGIDWRCIPGEQIWNRGTAGKHWVFTCKGVGWQLTRSIMVWDLIPEKKKKKQPYNAIQVWPMGSLGDPSLGKTRRLTRPFRSDLDLGAAQTLPCTCPWWAWELWRWGTPATLRVANAATPIILMGLSSKISIKSWMKPGIKWHWN